MGEQALKFLGQLYEVEREASTTPADQRKALRQQRSRPVADALRQWLTQQRQKVPDGSATARAIDYSVNRWAARVRFIDDGNLPIDNNWVENQIRPIAIGRNNWLFAGSLRAGKRAAAIMSLVHSARLNGLEPYAYLRDVLERLPTHPASRIAELLPHCWQPPETACLNRPPVVNKGSLDAYGDRARAPRGWRHEQDRAEDTDVHPATADPAALRCGERADTAGSCGDPIQLLGQAPVQAHVIENGMCMAGPLAHLPLAKFKDHLPRLRQQHIFERAGQMAASSTTGKVGGRVRRVTAAAGAGARRPASRDAMWCWSPYETTVAKLWRQRD